jgi:adenine deaminase
MKPMDKASMKRLIDAAMHRIPADLVLRSCQMIDVCGGTIKDTDIALIDGRICGFGSSYHSAKEIDMKHRYAAPGLIDSHIHIESSYVTPEEFGRMVVPHGTTTVIADPHEIVNVYGLDGFNYMIRSATRTELSVRYMVPSCVPATPFDDSGAVISALDMIGPMSDRHVPGLGEFMNYVGVANGEEECIDKLMTAREMHKVVDGHGPGMIGDMLNAYAATGIATDHECSTVEEMQERIAKGMYASLRDGSAAENLDALIPGITEYNYRRCLLCSDDRQPKTIIEKGHIDAHLRKLVKAGIDPVKAVAMATINAAECYHLEDRGYLAPGMRADIVFFEDLKDFKVNEVYIEGRKTAKNGKYLLKYDKYPIDSVRGSMHVNHFTEEMLKMHLKSDRVRAIEIIPHELITKEAIETVKLDSTGDFVYQSNQDVAKIAVLERHHSTGRIGLGLLKGYGIQHGAIASSVSHDSHNIICVGVSNREMAAAIRALIDQEGGFVVVRNGKVIASLPLPVAGLMSDQSGEWVAERLSLLHETAYDKLGIHRDVEPIMTLSFMALIVIPKLKITDRGLFDTDAFKFVPVEVSSAKKKNR